MHMWNLETSHRMDVNESSELWYLDKLKLFSEGSNSDNFFLVDEEREDPNTIKSVSSLARQRNAI